MSGTFADSCLKLQGKISIVYITFLTIVGDPICIHFGPDPVEQK
jgi:hypothetical protein